MLLDLEKSKRSDLAPDWNEDLIQDDDDVQPETENDIGPSVMIQYSTQTRQTFVRAQFEGSRFEADFLFKPLEPPR